MLSRLATQRIALRCVARPSAIPALRFKSTHIQATEVPESAIQQAPNRETTWTESQAPRSTFVEDPRFVGIDFDGQPRPMAAIDLIAEEPVRQIEGRLACCDGGGGALGHPRVWINLDEGKPESCGYCKLLMKGVWFGSVVGEAWVANFGRLLLRACRRPALPDEAPSPLSLSILFLPVSLKYTLDIALTCLDTCMTAVLRHLVRTATMLGRSRVVPPGVFILASQLELPCCWQ
ncbi:hypothetical protein FBU59_001506 [Linderina macrospora]|uniref:Uncharacterized protein n=1 Tax=Linderina macrospora TaxID=4868 RepID=A0ACC1JDU9_9FUNG|nr:hypothetical protein FBU59_001506 [Linderina macrospora]